MNSRIYLLLASCAVNLCAGIAGTKHDLSVSGTGTAKTTNVSQICVFCHTPHNAAKGAAKVIPLWNKATTPSTGFTMKNQTTNPEANLEGVVDATPNSPSMVCLTCHDGTQAIGNVLNLPSGVEAISYAAANSAIDVGGRLIGPSGLIGKDLTNEHPISITYPSTNSRLVAKSAVLGLTNSVKLFGPVGSEKVECSSCHDAHDNTNPPFLRVSMTNNALCATCHIP